MATHWVAPTSGNDANDGSTYALRKQTISGSMALVNADTDATVTLNLCDDGNYVAEQFSSSVQIHNAAQTIDYTITGVEDNDTETPAVVTFVGREAVGSSFGFYLRSANSFLVKYVSFDRSGWVGSETFTMVYHNQSGAAAPIIVEYSSFTEGLGPTGPTGNIRILGAASSYRTDLMTIRYCYLENVSSQMTVGGNPSNISFHDNVVIDDFTTAVAYALSAIFQGPNFGTVAGLYEFYNNTLCRQTYNNSTWTALGWINTIASPIDVGEVNIWNNIIWMDNHATWAGSNYGGHFDSNALGTNTVSSGTRGGNVYYTGPGIAATDVDQLVYGTEWDEPVAGIYATDTEVYESTLATLFNDATTTYTWTPTGSAVTFTIAKDLRPILELDSGVGGTLPGALPAAQTNYTVTTVTDRTGYKVSGGAFVSAGFGTATILNTGTDATGVAVTLAIPSSGITTVLVTPSKGTYSGGVWTVGDLDDAETATITWSFTVDDDATAGDRTFTATVTTGSPNPGIDTSDDTDSAVFEIRVPPASSGDPESPLTQPFLDVVPLNADEWAMDLNVAMQTKRNRLRRHYLRSDIEEKFIREISMRRIEVATNTSQQVVMGGIEVGEFLILESDVQVDVSVGNTTGLWIAGTLFIVSGGDFEQLHVRNNSTTVEAAVQYGVTD